MSAETTAQARKLQARTIKTQEAILEAALQEFSDHGYEGVSLRRIGELAEVNHRLTQHHFGCKEMLWQATARYAIGKYEARLDARSAALEGVNPADHLRLMMREFILFSAECPALNRFMLQANESKERMAWLVENLLKPSKYAYLTWLKRAQEQDLLIDGDPARLHYIFVGAATSIFAFKTEFANVTGLDPFDPKIVDEHVDMVLSLFLKSPQPKG